jgi:hypothetical protein
MPLLTADNLAPYLWNVVATIKDFGLGPGNVQFILTYPESNEDCFKEIFDQKPACNTAVSVDTVIEININPDCGYFVDTKKDWYQKCKSESMTKNQVSEKLWMLGELQLLLRSPADLVRVMFARSVHDASIFSETDLKDYGIFSDTEQLTLARLLPFKRNSHLVAVLSLMFSQILEIDFLFRQTFNHNFPHILSARVASTRDIIKKQYWDKILALEQLLIPVTCEVIYFYQFPLIILDNPDAILDNSQLG